MSTPQITWDEPQATPQITWDEPAKEQPSFVDRFGSRIVQNVKAPEKMLQGLLDAHKTEPHPKTNRTAAEIFSAAGHNLAQMGGQMLNDYKDPANIAGDVATAALTHGMGVEAEPAAAAASKAVEAPKGASLLDHPVAGPIMDFAKEILIKEGRKIPGSSVAEAVYKILRKVKEGDAPPQAPAPAAPVEAVNQMEVARQQNLHGTTNSTLSPDARISFPQRPDYMGQAPQAPTMTPIGKELPSGMTGVRQVIDQAVPPEGASKATNSRLKAQVDFYLKKGNVEKAVDAFDAARQNFPPPDPRENPGGYVGSKADKLDDKIIQDDMRAEFQREAKIVHSEYIDRNNKGLSKMEMARRAKEAFQQAKQPEAQPWDDLTEILQKSVEQAKMGKPASDLPPLFHGTKSGKFTAFDLRNAGQSDPGLVGKAVYLTPSREQAASFAESPHYGRGANPHVIEANAN
jgi:hypothetical protein